MTDISAKYKAFNHANWRHGKDLWTVREAIDYNLANPFDLIWYLVMDGEKYRWEWNPRTQLFDGYKNERVGN